MRKLILRNFQSAGDIVMPTAAVRDLHRSYPGDFATDVRTPFPGLWAGNPHLTPLAEDDPAVRVIDCHCPLIHRSNTTPCHFLHGFTAFLNDTLGLRIRVTDFKGDIYVSDEEKRWFSAVEEAKGRCEPFWRDQADALADRERRASFRPLRGVQPGDAARGADCHAVVEPVVQVSLRRRLPRAECVRTQCVLRRRKPRCGSRAVSRL